MIPETNVIMSGHGLVPAVSTQNGLVPAYYRLDTCSCGILFQVRNRHHIRCRACQKEYRKHYHAFRSRKRRAAMKRGIVS